MKYERLLVEAEIELRQLLAEQESRVRAQLEFERERDLALYRKGRC